MNSTSGTYSRPSLRGPRSASKRHPTPRWPKSANSHGPNTSKRPQIPSSTPQHSTPHHSHRTSTPHHSTPQHSPGAANERQHPPHRGLRCPGHRLRRRWDVRSCHGCIPRDESHRGREVSGLRRCHLLVRRLGLGAGQPVGEGRRSQRGKGDLPDIPPGGSR